MKKPPPDSRKYFDKAKSQLGKLNESKVSENVRALFDKGAFETADELLEDSTALLRKAEGNLAAAGGYASTEEMFQDYGINPATGQKFTPEEQLGADLQNAVDDPRSRASSPVPWKRVCSLLERPQLQRNHPTWSEMLRRCAVFDLQTKTFPTRTDHPDPEPFEHPPPFPQTAYLSNDAFIAVRNYRRIEDEESGELRAVEFELLGVCTPLAKYAGNYEHVINATIRWDATAVADQQWDYSDISLSIITFGKLKSYNKPKENLPSTTRLLHRFVALLGGVSAFINQEESFIVAESPKKIPKTKRGKIPRMYARNRYIVLKKNEVKKRYLDSQPSGRKPTMPHLRRGHFRTLQSPRYHERGRRVWVRATHVKGNEVEWREGDRFYRVL